MFIIYAGIGVGAVKIHLYDHDDLDVFCKYIVKISLPLMIFTNTINGATKEEFLSGLPILITTVFMYICLFFLSLLLSKVCKSGEKEKNVYRACVIFGNIGFMGIPIVNAVFPERGMLYIALFTVVDQMIIWTLGVNLCIPTDGEYKIPIKNRVLKMINPNTVAILLSVIVIFTEVQIPEFLNIALTKIGATTSPLAMTYLGGIFCYVHLGNFMKKKEIYGTILLKMLLFPILFHLLLSVLPFVKEEIVITMTFLSMLPTMSSIPMIAESQHGNGDYAVGMLFVTTLFSVATIPVICLVL